MPRQRDAHDDIAMLTHQPSQPAPLGAGHDGDGAAVVGRIVVLVAIHVQPVDPDAPLLERLERARQVADLRDADVVNRAGGRTSDHGRHRSRAAVGEDEAMHAGCIGGTQNRPQVVRVLHSVERQQEGRFVLATGVRHDLVEREVADRPDLGQGALMTVRSRAQRQRLGVELGDVDALLERQVGQLDQTRALLVPTLEEDATYAAGAQRLLYRMDPEPDVG